MQKNGLCGYAERFCAMSLHTLGVRVDATCLNLPKGSIHCPFQDSGSKMETESLNGQHVDP